MFRDWSIHKKGWTNDQSLRHEIISVDEDYFKTIGVPLIAGRINPTKVIVNATNFHAMDIPLDDAIAHILYFVSRARPLRIRYSWSG